MKTNFIKLILFYANSYILSSLSLYRSWEVGCNLDFQNPNFELQPASRLLYTESSLYI